MSLPFSVNEIDQHIRQNTAACVHLLQLLEQEQVALKTRDADSLEQILQKKVPLLDEMENSAKLRESWARAAHINGESNGWIEFFEKAKQTALADAWSHLKKLTKECRDRNEVNGHLLARNKKTLSRLLNVLRGKNATTTLYNAYGASSTSAQTQKVGEA